LFTVYNGGNHHTDDDRVKLLKELAAEMGYTITKKRKTKRKAK